MKPRWEKWIRFRLIFTLMVFLLLMVTAGGRAYQLQILKQPELFTRASSQNTIAVDLQPSRGVIFDRGGHELAVSVEVDSVFAHPRKITDPDQASKQLSDILTLSYQDVLKKLSSSSSFVWVKRGVTPAEGEQIKKANIAGIDFIPETKRYYPHRENAGHLLGFVGVDGRGLEGLELQYNQQLSGGRCRMMAERDAHGRLFLTSGYVPFDATQGQDLLLTIDLTIQCIMEKELRTAVENAEARGGMGIVMDPKTGEVLAMAVQPAFNPNNYRSSGPEVWRNRIVTDCFDPGSTFKVFLAAAALEEGVVRLDDRIYCENGAYRVCRKTIHDVHKYEDLSFSEVIKYSSNIGVVKVAEQMESQVFYSHIRDFGFGEKTGIEFRGESPGLLRPYQEWREIDKLNIAFGQGIAITALQLVNGMCAIANGGYVMRPYVVKAIIDNHGGNQKTFHPAVVKRAISAETARSITDIMTQVVSDGTGQNAAIPGIKVAGKTGTAQKLDPSTGAYSRKKYVGLFMAFAPADDPRLAVLVVIDEPKGRGFGGTVAAPAVRAVIEQVLPSLNVYPTEDTTPLVVDGEMILTLDKSNNNTNGAVVFFPDEMPPDKIPNFTGLSMRRVLQLGQDLNLAVQVQGSGKAVSQEPAPGQPLTGVTTCRVVFEPAG